MLKIHIFCYYWCCRGGLLPDKYCGDYPHVEGVRDGCIQEAVHDLINVKPDQDLGMGLSVTSPMPYRWLPLGDSHFRRHSSY